MAPEKPSQSVTSQAVLDINVEPAQVQSSDGDSLLKILMAERQQLSIDSLTLATTTSGAGLTVGSNTTSP